MRERAPEDDGHQSVSANKDEEFERLMRDLFDKIAGFKGKITYQDFLEKFTQWNNFKS